MPLFSKKNPLATKGNKLLEGSGFTLGGVGLFFYVILNY